MPEKRTLAKARKAKRQKKAPSTQAGAFVEEEMRHAKGGKHPVKSRKQAVAIGLSKARRSGVKVPKKGASSSSSKSRTKSVTSKRRASNSRTSRGRSSSRKST